MTSSYWLFSFTYYTYCQGTRDHNESIRLLKFTLPCEEWEAKSYLLQALRKEGLEEVKMDSIKCLTILIANS